jgi:hypothetical protein
MTTPTPRTDDFCNGLRSNCLETTQGAVDLANFARQLEQELNEAIKLTQSLAEDKGLFRNERDQLRKVADELANIIYVHSLRPQNALDGYNQLPHVRARKTK